MEVSTASPNELTHAPPGQTETLSLTFPPEGEPTAWPNAVLVATVFAPLMLVAWLNWWRAETRPTTGPTRQTWRDHERSKNSSLRLRLGLLTTLFFTAQCLAPGFCSSNICFWIRAYLTAPALPLLLWTSLPQMKILTLASAKVSRDGSIISTDASSSRFILFIIKLYILLLLVTGYADVLERHLLSNKYMAIAQLQMLLLCILALSFMFTHYVSILRRRLMQTMTQLKLQKETEGNVSARHVRGFNLSLVGTWLLVVFFIAIEASMTTFYVRQGPFWPMDEAQVTNAVLYESYFLWQACVCWGLTLILYERKMKRRTPMKSHMNATENEAPASKKTAEQRHVLTPGGTIRTPGGTATSTVKSQHARDRSLSSKWRRGRLDSLDREDTSSDLTTIPWSVYSNTMVPNDADQTTDQQIKITFESAEELPHVDSLIQKSPTAAPGRDLTANDTQILDGVSLSCISSSGLIDRRQDERAKHKPAAINNSGTQESDARSILRLHLSPRAYTNSLEDKSKKTKGDS